LLENAALQAEQYTAMKSEANPDKIIYINKLLRCWSGFCSSAEETGVKREGGFQE